MMTALIAWAWPCLAAGAAALLALIYAKGRADSSATATAADAAAYRETRERMDDADVEIHGDDHDAARRFLRERGQSAGDLLWYGAGKN